MPTNALHSASQDYDIVDLVNVTWALLLPAPSARPLYPAPTGLRPLPHRRPKSPCTSRRIRNAFRARTCAMSSRCEVSVVSTSLDVPLNGYFRRHKHQSASRASPPYPPPSKPDLLERTAANPRRQSASGACANARGVTRTLCRYSYATSVNPNCGLLRIMRAGPPLKNALKPSSRSATMPSQAHLSQSPYPTVPTVDHSQIFTNASVSPL